VTAPIAVRVLLEAHAVSPPAYQSEHASGMDLVAALEQDATITPGQVLSVPTGIRLEIPPGYEGQIRARSGLAARHAIGVPNAPGTIDADYRGEVQVLLVNLGREAACIRRGDRIAQLVIAPVTRVGWHEVTTLPESARGEGGFGSTG